MEDIEEQSYNTSAVNESPAGKIVRKVNYAPLTEGEYESVRDKSTVKCSAAKKDPCDPASKHLTSMFNKSCNDHKLYLRRGSVPLRYSK